MNVYLTHFCKRGINYLCDIFQKIFYFYFKRILLFKNDCCKILNERKAEQGKIRGGRHYVYIGFVWLNDYVSVDI